MGNFIATLPTNYINKTISIHQPNYLPWLGFFYKMLASDVFVLHDNVEYTKQSFTKRVFIRKHAHATDLTYLSVPLRKHSDFVKIKDLEICQKHNWQIKHLNKIYNTYHKAPFFNQYYPILQKLIRDSKNQQYLTEINETLIRFILQVLKSQTLLFCSSELPLHQLKADAYNAEIVAYLGGDVYISGQGAKKYQSENMYQEKDIDLIYNNLGQYLKELPPQYPAPFLTQVSIIDALFYMGSEGILHLFEQYRWHDLKTLQHLE